MPRVPQPRGLVFGSHPGGNRGLIRSAEKFDTLRLQVLYVRDVVDPAGHNRAIADKGRTIRILPVHMVEKVNNSTAPIAA